MITIRRIHDCLLPSEKDRVEQVRGIFRHHFPEFGDYDAKIPTLLRSPFRYGYRTVLLVSLRREKVTGFSLILHFPETNSSLLDFLAVAPGIRGGGLGQALYEATREYLVDIGSRGMYLEVLSDEASLLRDKTRLAENKRRMKFYEQFGARPIIGTDYEKPIAPDIDTPSLLFDPLDRTDPLGRDEARRAVRLILQRKYSHMATRSYIDEVVESFQDDPVRVRPARYARSVVEPVAVARGRLDRPFVMVVSQGHAIHHVHERGYVERPARIPAVLEGLGGSGLFRTARLKSHGEAPIRQVHDGDFVSYLRNLCSRLSGSRPVYPYVFPIRRPQSKPKDLAMRAGYYCIDTFTPLDANAYNAARSAVDTALTAADELLAGARVAYALCRPPGHHAGRRTFGGFCYFNNAAIAAARLAATGKTAILDIDYHHGNGTQDIFYERGDVLTLSIHSHPNDAYPFFSGFADETGEGAGAGFNKNFPLDGHADEAAYMAAIGKAVRRIGQFRPHFLVLSLGLDILKGDPTGTFSLPVSTMRRIGRQLAELGLPMLVVQEGGYNLSNLKRGPAELFAGIAEAIVR